MKIWKNIFKNLLLGFILFCFMLTLFILYQFLIGGKSTVEVAPNDIFRSLLYGSILYGLTLISVRRSKEKAISCK